MNAPTCVSKVSTVHFHGQELALLFDADQQPLVAMKPICENIGLLWQAQFNRIKRDEVLSSAVSIMDIPSPGGKQKTVCLPLEYLNGWLFGIDVKRVKPEIRPQLIRYKKDCYKVLAAHWLATPAPAKPEPVNYHFTLDQWLACNPGLAAAHDSVSWMGPHWDNKVPVSVPTLLQNNVVSPTWDILMRLKKQGYDVSACEVEQQSMRHFLERYHNAATHAVQLFNGLAHETLNHRRW